jgi:arginase family enzyme
LRKYAQDHEKSSMSKQVIALVGAPTDIGAGHRGASMGPEALRVAQLAEKLRRRGLEVIDRRAWGDPSRAASRASADHVGW